MRLPPQLLVGALAASALFNRHWAKKAEQEQTPGRSIPSRWTVSGSTTWNEAPVNRWCF